MKKLILISALLFSFNGWANLIGITNMPCEVFLETYANADKDTRLVLGIEIYDFLLGVNSGTKVSRFEENIRTFPLRDLRSNTNDFKLANIANSCEKEKDKKVIMHLMDYWMTLPILDEEKAKFGLD